MNYLPVIEPYPQPANRNSIDRTSFDCDQDPSVADPSVSQLIGHVRMGCDRSREQLYEILRNYFSTLAQRYHHQQLKAKVGVSDIVQQSMLRVVEKFAGFQGKTESELKAWLKTLLINEIRQSARSFLRKRRDIKREINCATSGTSPLSPVQDPNPTPQSISIQNEQLESLKKCLRTLSQNDQKIIQLRSFEQLSFDEIAQVTGRTADAVAKQWYRAIIKLQRELASEKP